MLGKTMQLQDVQIVNGLQTTESIFRHFASGAKESADRALLIKVVVSNNTALRDQIIRATNNQSPVELASLHATDKIQRDIEEVLERSGWFYERRKNYYRNIGKPEARFVTPMYIAAGCVALVLRDPALAARLKSRFMRAPEAYSAVFSEHTPLGVWPVIVEVLKRVEEVLEEVRPSRGKGERFLVHWRNVLGLLVIARTLGTFAYSINELVSVDLSKLSKETILEMWHFVRQLQSSKQEHWDHTSHAEYYCSAAAKEYGIAGAEIIGRRKLQISKRPAAMPAIVNEEFLQLVDSELPPQPWKPGVHLAVAAKLGCKPASVSVAINALMKAGKRMTQRDGVVYDKDGSVFAVDSERVPGATSIDRRTGIESTAE